MELNINVKGDNPIEIAMMLKGIVAKQAETVVNNNCAPEPLRFQWHWPTPNIAQVGDQTFIWYDEAGAPVGVEYSVTAAQNAVDQHAYWLNQPKKAGPVEVCGDGSLFVGFEVIQDNDFLLLTRYGDCLYVLCELGVPVWCGHSLGQGRDEAQRRQDKRDGVERVVEYSQEQPKLPEMSVGIVDPPAEPEPEPSKLQAKVAGPGFQEPRYDEDTQVVDPQAARVKDEGGYYWPEGTRCQFGDCTEYLRIAARLRENGYCAKHRNS